MRTLGFSPWFPGFSLYRQAIDLNWNNALEQLSKNLQKIMKSLLN